MCLNCGCGEYDKRHKPSDITMDDLKESAKGQGMDIRKAATNLQEAGRAIGQQGQEGHKQEGHEPQGHKPV
jgi:hypothetical protein